MMPNKQRGRGALRIVMLNTPCIFVSIPLLYSVLPLISFTLFKCFFSPGIFSLKEAFITLFIRQISLDEKFFQLCF